MPARDHIPLLYRALNEPIGLLVSTNDAKRLRQQLYLARTEALDPALEILQFRMSPFPDGQIVICKGQTLAVQRQENLDE
jgi:hypothetical protein